MFEFTTDVVLLLALAGFVAGFIDSIAGGGGLIAIPALLLAGATPIEALATNKLQGTFGSASSTITYVSRGLIDVRQQLPSMAMTTVGSIAGALAASSVPDAWLKAALPVLLVAIAVYFAVKPSAGDLDRHAYLTPVGFAFTAALAIGFYDGVFGPGTGSFLTLAFTTLAGYGLLKATAHTKLLNFSSNLGALVAFAAGGAILWKIGLVMGAAQFLGARVGAITAVRIGSKIIKPLLVTICTILAIKLLLDPTNPIHIWVIGKG